VCHLELYDIDPVTSENRRSRAALVSSRHCSANNRFDSRRRKGAVAGVNVACPAFNFQTVFETIQRKTVGPSLARWLSASAVIKRCADGDGQMWSGNA
jgi:hypothetical protein